MRNRTFLILISLLLALSTAGAALYWLKTQSGNTAKTVEKSELWTAKEDIPAGSEIKDSMIEKVKVPKDQIPPDAYTDSKDIIGHFAKSSILKGESFPPQRIYTDADKLLSMKLEPGYRAFSITMTRYSAVADMIQPGDRVDIFVFLKELAGAEMVIRPDIAQVLLQNVEVLAVRQETQPEDPDPKEVSELYAVTVAVPLKSVEKLILGEETGLLKIALRPYEEDSTYTSYGVIWKELLLDPSMNIRDFEPEYGTTKGTDVLLNALPNQLKPEEPSSVEVEVSVPSSPALQPPAAAKKASYSVYTVQPGDTLMSISRKFFNGSSSRYDDIMEINGLSDQVINPGQKLRIPLSGR